MINVESTTLAYIRNTVSNFLTDSCIIKSPSRDTSTSYAPQVGYSIVSSGVACRVLPNSSGSVTDAQLFADKQIVGRTYAVILPYDTEIKAGYVLDINNEDYNVIAIEQQQTDKAFVKVIATKPS